MKKQNDINQLVDAYNLLVKGIETQANNDDERAYGGIIRAGKGLLVENLARKIIEISLKKLKIHPDRFSLNKQTVKIPINLKYIERIKSPEVKEYIKKNIKDFYYTLKTDVHVYIDSKFAIAIECKAYTENAMLKRILVDFTLFQQVYPDLNFVLFQLESELGGDYSIVNKKTKYGSKPTHTLLSYFDIDLNIITLLEGERKVNRPIHKKENFKELKKQSLVDAIDVFTKLLEDKIIIKNNMKYNISLK